MKNQELAKFENQSLGKLQITVKLEIALPLAKWLS